MYNPNSGYGQALINAVHAAVPTFGRIFIVFDVDSTDEENYSKMQAVFKPDPRGVVRFCTTAAAALALVESNNNDVIVFDGSDTHPVTAVLDVTVSRTHFIGLDYLMGIHRAYGSGAKLSMGVTTAAADIAVIKNTGVRNSFRGLKIMSSNTKDESLYAFADGGEFTYIEGCELYKSTDLNEDGAAELLCNGDGSLYRKCYIGSTVDAITATGARPCVLMSRETISGKVARDVRFDDCILARKIGDTGNFFVYGSGATDVERMCLIEDCKFWNTALAGATPAENVGFGAAQTEGSVLLNNCVAMKGATAMSTTTGVFVNGCDNGGDSTTEGAAQIGIALQAT